MASKVQQFVFSPFQENSFVVYDETKECVIIDPGCFTNVERNELKKFIESNDLKPVALWNTHSHLDHVFGNAFVQRTWGLTPQVHPKDKRVYDMFEATVAVYQIMGAETPPEPEYNLAEGKDVSFGNSTFKVHFLPGHCPGHVAFENVDDNYIIVGDVLFQRSIGRTDLPGGDQQTLMDSIHNKLMKLDLSHKVYCGHGETTTLKEEKEHNPFLN
ncbi:MAG: MBL fold metallo-hydrolase [Salibacteraceae bacterium]